MRITRSTLRRLIAEESARLLREAAEEESAATNEAERGKKGKGRDNNCLYVLYGGMGVYYYVAKGGLSEEEAAEKGQDVTAELAGDEGMADPLSLYDWLQNHDGIEYVYDDESMGGFEEKEVFMEQLRDVGEEEGLFADDEFINEEEDLDETEDMTDTAYNDYLQSRHGRFTSPEEVKGTPQHRAIHGPYNDDRRGAPSTPMGPASGEELERIRARLAAKPPQPLVPHWGPNSPDQPYYDVRHNVRESRDADVDCLYILKRGGQHVYIVARPYIDNAAELDETGRDITDMIMSQGPAARNSNVYEFLSSNPDVAVVRVRGAYEMADDYMMELEDSLGASTGPVYEGAFPEELEGVYGEEPPEFDEMGPGDDSFLDYNPEEIPDMDDQYDPDYYEGLDDEEDDSWADIETGEDDVPYGAADVALRMGRGYRTDEAAAPVNEARWAKLAGILKG